MCCHRPQYPGGDGRNHLPPGATGAWRTAILASGRVCCVAGANRRHADVAQLVAHHLAKVRVAGSNPVIRSASASRLASGGVAEW